MGRKVSHDEVALRLGRRRIRVGRRRVEDVVHPGLRVRAAVTRGRRCLVHAARRTRGAVEPHVEMIVVAVPRPDLAQPRPVAGLVVAHLHLGAGEDEDTRGAGVLGRGLDHLPIGDAEEFGHDESDGLLD